MIFLFLLVALSLAEDHAERAVTTPSCPTSRDNLVSCFRELLDLNHDSTIDAAEIDTFLHAQTCIDSKVTSKLSGSILIRLCDANADGVLTLADWTASDGCITETKRVNMFCEICLRCGWSAM